jgi:hypothetical protein
MKTLSLIIFCLFLISLQLKAQSEELLDNTWYLEKVVIGNVDYFVPDNEEINQVSLDFETDFIYTIPMPSGCFSYIGGIFFQNNTNSFSSDGASPSFLECSLEENVEFYRKYIDEFYWLDFGNATQVFTYEITEEFSTLKKLTITNTNDDQVIYYSETLSIQDVEGLGFIKVYPNPASTHFSIESQFNLEQIKVYNELGQVVVKFKAKEAQSSYDISKLSNGLYFVEITSLECKKTVRKLVKK